MSASQLCQDDTSSESPPTPPQMFFNLLQLAGQLGPAPQAGPQDAASLFSRFQIPAEAVVGGHAPSAKSSPHPSPLKRNRSNTRPHSKSQCGPLDLSVKRHRSATNSRHHLIDGSNKPPHNPSEPTQLPEEQLPANSLSSKLISSSTSSPSSSSCSLSSEETNSLPGDHQPQAQPFDTNEVVISSSADQATPQSTRRRQKHRKLKSHLCLDCGRAFSRSDMLTRHSRLHSGLKPYQCSRCKQVFSRSDHLSTHERTHTGEKPYQCQQCTYSACRRDMITRHMRTHNQGPNSVTNARGKQNAAKTSRHRKTGRSNHRKLEQAELDPIIIY